MRAPLGSIFVLFCLYILEDYFNMLAWWYVYGHFSKFSLPSVFLQSVQLVNPYFHGLRLDCATTMSLFLQFDIRRSFFFLF